MIFKNLIKRLKRLIISSSNYWKIRHFLEPTWIDSYNLKKTHQFYIEFVQKYSVKTIFDFGCATGKTLLDIKINFPEVVTYGVDINQNTIDLATKNAIDTPLSIMSKCKNLFDIIDAPLGGTKKNALDSLKNGDPCAVGAVISDGLPRFVGRSKNTPPTTRKIHVERSEIKKMFN